MATRCASPPESFAGKAFLRLPDLEIVEEFDRPLARSRVARSRRVAARCATLSMALRKGSRLWRLEDEADLVQPQPSQIVCAAT